MKIFRFGDGFQVRSFFHATSVVADMTVVADLHRRLFGVESTTLGYVMHRWATMAIIGDVSVEATCPNLDYASPKRMFLQLAGNHWSPAVFWVDDVVDGMYHGRTAHGYGYTHQWGGGPVEGIPEGRPEHAVQVYSNPFQTGIDWGLFEMDASMPVTQMIYEQVSPFELTGTYTPLPPRDDVVSVERHAQHCVVTDEPEKTLRFLVDALGGTVFDETHHAPTNARSTFVSLGVQRPFTVEVAVPTGPGAAATDLARNGSIYHRLDFKVHDFDAALRHVEREGIALETKGDDFVVLDPRDTHGLRYGLFAELHAHDPRGFVR